MNEEITNQITINNETFNNTEQINYPIMAADAEPDSMASVSMDARKSPAYMATGISSGSMTVGIVPAPMTTGISTVSMATGISPASVTVSMVPAPMMASISSAPLFSGTSSVSKAAGMSPDIIDLAFSEDEEEQNLSDNSLEMRGTSLSEHGILGLNPDSIITSTKTPTKTRTRPSGAQRRKIRKLNVGPQPEYDITTKRVVPPISPWESSHESKWKRLESSTPSSNGKSVWQNDRTRQEEYRTEMTRPGSFSQGESRTPYNKTSYSFATDIDRRPISGGIQTSRRDTSSLSRGNFKETSRGNRYDAKTWSDSRDSQRSFEGRAWNNSSESKNVKYEGRMSDTSKKSQKDRFEDGSTWNNFRESQRDSFRESQRDSFRESQRDSFRESQRDSFRENRKDSFRENQRDSFKELKLSQTDSFRESQRDKFDRSISYPTERNQWRNEKSKQTDSKMRADVARPSTITANEAGDTFGKAPYPHEIAIVPVDYPVEKISPNQVKIIQNIIFSEMFKCEPFTGTQLSNSYARDGAVFMTCANEQARLWLARTISTIRPWEGAKLKISSAQAAKTHRFSVWSRETPESILKSLGSVKTMTVWNDDSGPIERRILSNTQKRQLKKLREMGVDTSKISLPVTEKKPLGAPALTGPVKRSASTRRIPWETGAKRSKLSSTGMRYRIPSRGIKAAVVPKDYPTHVVTQEHVGQIQEALMTIIDKAPRAPRLESFRLMDGYYGVICADEASYATMKDFLDRETVWTLIRNYKLQLLNKQRGHACLPETKREDLSVGLREFERQNPELRPPSLSSDKDDGSESDDSNISSVIVRSIMPTASFGNSDGGKPMGMEDPKPPAPGDDNKTVDKPTKPAEGMQSIGPVAGRMSGAQKKRLMKARKMAAGTWTVENPYKAKQKAILKGKAEKEESERAGKKPQSEFQPSPNTNTEAKKPRDGLEPRTSSVQGIRLAVIQGRHPDVVLDQGQADLVQDALVNALCAASSNSTSPPQFLKTTLSEGVLWMTCANMETAAWLRGAIRSLGQLWEGADLRVVEAKALPTRPKVLVFVPEPEETTVDTVKTRIRMQNPDLRTADWTNVSRKVEKEGQLLTFSIDEVSLKALQGSQYSAFYKLGRLSFRVLGKRHDGDHTDRD